MIDNFGEAIAKIRKNRKMTQLQVVDLMARHGVSLNKQAVSRWELGLNCPRADQFLIFCKVMGVTDIYAEFFGMPSPVKSPFSGLNSEGQKMAQEYITFLRESGRYTVVPRMISLESTFRTLPLYDIAVSAGTCQFLDSEHFEMIEVSDDVPASANFGVRIAGNSMEPRFVNGQVVWVHQQIDLEDGQVGIFLYNGDVFCKKFSSVDGHVSLVSLNSEYKPIKVSATDELRVFGRVVGQLPVSAIIPSSRDAKNEPKQT